MYTSVSIMEVIEEYTGYTYNSGSIEFNFSIPDYWHSDNRSAKR